MFALKLFNKEKKKKEKRFDDDLKKKKVTWDVPCPIPFYKNISYVVSRNWWYVWKSF
jgi:hypothetical protein